MYHRFSSGGDNGAPPTAAWEEKQGDQCVLEHGHCRARGGFGSDFLDRVDALKKDPTALRLAGDDTEVVSNNAVPPLPALRATFPLKGGREKHGQRSQ